MLYIMKLLRKCQDCGSEAYTKEDLKKFKKNKKLMYSRENLCLICVSKRHKNNYEKLKSSEEYKEERRKYYLLNKKYIRKQVKVRLAENRQKVLDLFGDKCVHCGYDFDWRAFQIDHINSDGSVDRAIGLTGNRLHRHILQLSDEERRAKYQLLCANCNTIKKFENNESSGSIKVVFKQTLSELTNETLIFEEMFPPEAILEIHREEQQLHLLEDQKRINELFKRAITLDFFFGI